MFNKTSVFPDSFCDSKRQQIGRKIPCFCQRKPITLFLNRGVYFGMPGKFPPKRKMGGHRPHEMTLSFGNTAFPALQKQKSGNPFRRSPCLGAVIAETGFRLFYFQSLKIFSSALSRAASKLFSTTEKTSFSKMDCYFFSFFSRSFRSWSVILPLPHL